MAAWAGGAGQPRRGLQQLAGGGQRVDLPCTAREGASLLGSWGEPTAFHPKDGFEGCFPCSPSSRRFLARGLAGSRGLVWGICGGGGLGCTHHMVYAGHHPNPPQQSERRPWSLRAWACPLGL